MPTDDDQFSNWYDSGASNHITVTATNFSFIDMTRKGKVCLASKAGKAGSSMAYVGVGEVASQQPPVTVGRLISLSRTCCWFPTW